MADYYELLGVSRTASEDEIKRAYRQAARRYHPDANSSDPDAEARFREITEAYETLRDPERRRRYDTFGPDADRMGAHAGAPGDMFGAGLGDLFDAFFGGAGFTGGRRGGPRRGDDVEIAIELEFRDAVFGVERELQVRAAIVCETCGGSGARAGTTPIRCANCSGSGQIRRVRQSILGQVVSTLPCDRCRGLGEVIESPCTACAGDGRALATRTVHVAVPAGVDHGTTLRLTGEGGAAFRQGVPGDLYVHLRVTPDPRFERSGDDLVTTLHVAMTQAALGAELDVATLEGPEPVQIAPGTASGKVLRLRGHGVPHMRGRGRGDLHVRIEVDTPGALDDEQERVLRMLAGLRGEAVAEPETGLIHRIRSSFG